MTQPHAFCSECKEIPVCHIDTVCDACMRDFHYITDKIAIGNSSASYDYFDIVVNMNYPQNGVEHGKIKYEYIEEKNLHLIKYGIEDCFSYEYAEFARTAFYQIYNMIKILRDISKKDKKNPKYKEFPRILFHCYAGVSRSVSAAIYYISKETCLSTKTTYNIVKKRRKVARPNKCFLYVLEI